MTSYGRRKRSDEIRERLLERIQQGDFAPGDPLPSERELMQLYGVGRPAIREALQSLQRMSLLDIHHGRRARVAAPSVPRMVDQIGESMRLFLAHSPASLEQLKQARLVFEMEMARIAARRHSASDIVRLRRLLQTQAEAQNDLERFVACDGDFHREIAAISGNPIFTALSEAVFKWLAATYRGAVSVPGLEKLTLNEHAQILDAIAAGMAEAAAKTMADHLNRANELYRTANYRAAS
jgi:GntR family transcriptional regulator, sialic acid-inducible nan operon repressor